MKDRKIKILWIITRLNVGGPAIQAINLTRELNNEEFETALVHGVVCKGELDITGFRGMDVEHRILLPELGRELHPVKDIGTVIKLIGIIRRERPDIIHTHTAKAGAVGRFAGAVCRVPVIIHTYHGHVFHGYFSPFKTALFKMIEKFLAAFTTKIITISPCEKNDIQRILRIDPEKIAVILLGFNLDKFVHCGEKYSGEFRKAIGAAPGAKIISIVGRITAIKNHKLFLETAKLLIEKRDDLFFAVVGGGELLEECERTTEQLGIAEKVVFAGWWEEVEKVYADTDVTVLTSINEGTPTCLIESLSAGVPVVATNVGGVADVVRNGETGFLVPPGDSSALASRILELIDNPPLREKMGRAGKDDMLKRYSEKRLVDDIVSMYRDLG